MDADKRATIESLRYHVERICAGRGAFRDMREVEPRIGQGGLPAEPLKPKGPQVPFGRWLRQQSGNFLTDGGLRAELIAYAMADRGFPEEGTPQDLRKRMIDMMADGDMHAALDDAELDWACW